MIDEDAAQIIDELNIPSIEIRSVLTCESRHGVCAKCYGRNMGTAKPVDIGEAVGIIAAQSIGQPGTQLTMRTFHIGGIASSSFEESDIKLNYPVLIKDLTFKTIKTEGKKIISVRRGYMIVQRVINDVPITSETEVKVEDGDKIYTGTVVACLSDGTEIKLNNSGIIKLDKKKLYLLGDPHSLQVNVGTEVYVKTGKIYDRGEILASFDPWLEPIISEKSGKAEFLDIEINKTLREEIDPYTNVMKRIIVEYRTEKLQPRINVNTSSEEPTTYLLPKGAYIMINDGDDVNAGDIMAKIPRAASRTKDITGGLPRVAELFEARVPKEAATLSELDGEVKIGDTIKNKRKVLIQSEDGINKEYSIPASRFLLVHDGDWIYKGEKIDEGPIDPHEILKIKGPKELQKFLVTKIQEVYRLQGVGINDKHIEVIVREMLKKVKITDAGDTNFVVEKIVDKFDFIDTNAQVVKEGGKAATAMPILIGITKAALNTESFISAASFQETTRVLTDAAIRGKIDHLRGLKENVIIGHLIPAGTGMPDYRSVDVYQDTVGDLDGAVQEEKLDIEEEVPIPNKSS